MRHFHNDMATLQSVKCSICFEQFPSISINDIGSCKRCNNDKHIPKLFSAANNMDPGIVPPELVVSNECCISACFTNFIYFKGLSEVEQMLISSVIPLMFIYRLPHGQYGYSGHVINLPQDIPLFVNSLPRQPSDLDIRKEGSGSNHRDFCMRRSKVLAALQWLVTNNAYFSNITINHNNLSTLPENYHLANIPTISVDEPDSCTNTMESQDHSEFCTFCTTFVPVHLYIQQ